MPTQSPLVNVNMEGGGGGGGEEPKMKLQKFKTAIVLRQSFALL